MLRLMFCLLFVGQALSAQTDSFDGLSSEDCKTAFDAITGVEKSLMPLIWFQLQMVEEYTGRLQISEAQIQDEASKKIGRIEAAFDLVADLCAPMDAKKNKRSVIDQNAISAENCIPAIAEHSPNLVRPLTKLEALYDRLRSSLPGPARQQVWRVVDSSGEVADSYNWDYRVAVRLCRYVQTFN